MKLIVKISFCTLLLLAGTQTSFAQKACCSKEQMAKCKAGGKASVASASKACCGSTKKLTTSGCTPSNCRGAKTKFGEAKVISDLRTALIALKAKMENHTLKFSNRAITVHDIIGESDDQSIEIIHDHLEIMELEIVAMTASKVPNVAYSDKKAIRVRQLKERISTVSDLL